MSYQIDRRWSDQYLPEIKRIVGPYLLDVSTFEVDTKQAADLVVLTGRNLTLACRIRKPEFADRYPFEFTIRARRDSGARTELEKITDGWGDWMFYGYAGVSGLSIQRWWLIDLSAWRAAMIRHRKVVSPQQKSNGDGTHFVAFDVRKFPVLPGCKPLVVASSHPFHPMSYQAA